MDTIRDRTAKKGWYHSIFTYLIPVFCWSMRVLPALLHFHTWIYRLVKRWMLDYFITYSINIEMY